MIDKKFIEVYNVFDWEIETDTGWKDIKSVGKTVPYKVFKIKTLKGYQLSCADTHIVFNESLEEIYVKDCNLFDTILTIAGPDMIISVEYFNYYETMFDLEIDDDNHRYYVSGILSHNSTWLANLAANAVKKGYNTAVISLEMKDSKVIKRLGANLLNVSMKEYDNFSKNPMLVKEKLEKFKINGIDLKIPGKLYIKQFPTSSVGIPDIENYLKHLEQIEGIKLRCVIIDYINILKNWRTPNSDNLYMKIKQIAEDMRAMLTRNNWAGFSASQVTRSGYSSSSITLSDVSESAGLIHTVDALFAINRNPLERGTIGNYTMKALALRNADGVGSEQKYLCDFDYMRIEEDVENNVERPDIFEL